MVNFAKSYLAIVKSYLADGKILVNFFKSNLADGKILVKFFFKSLLTQKKIHDVDLYITILNR